TASNSPRSTPGSSPSLRRRVLGGGKAGENEGGGEKSGGGSDSPLPSVPSASSLSSAYPLASRHFSRNAKKMQSWYNVLSPTYKQRNEDFRKIFKKLPDTERLIVYSCALQKDILLQGRLYLSENWLCFYSNIFRWETTITIQLKDVTSMTKEKTAKLIPNAIQISTENEKHFFTSFGARERSFMMIFRLWQNALLDKSLSPKELWHIVHQCYGTELGLTSEDDDYVSPTSEHMNGLPGDESVSVTDLLDLSTVSAPSAGSSPPPVPVHCSLTSPASAPVLSAAFLPSLASCPPIEVPSSSGSRLGSEPGEPSPPSSTGSVPAEGGDSQSESTNHMPPPSAASLGNLSSLDITNDEELPTDASNSSDTQEEQTLHQSCSRGECYVVDSEVITSGIPYQDYFYTVHRYCLTSISKHKSRLVSSDICYRKQPWSLVKTLIEKNTWSGIEEYYRNMSEVCKLETLLQTEVSVVTTGDAEGADAAKTPPSLRRRRRTCSRRQNEREGGGAEAGERGDRGVGEDRNRREAAQYMKLGDRVRGGGHGSISTVVLIVSFICILVVLVVLNMLLFYKLYALERAAHTLERWHSYSVADRPLPQTAGEWAQVLHLQRQFHQAQLSKWQQILQSSVSLLDQMKHSLEKLHKNIVVPEG
uniref:GRAM domain containing 1A n=1 Tax=Fundulus heteroclitus TaxID=8078 RepID=A0A3Q2Q0Y5_FUNHE